MIGVLIKIYFDQRNRAICIHVLVSVAQGWWIMHEIATMKEALLHHITCRWVNAERQSPLLAPLPSVHVELDWYPSSRRQLGRVGWNKNLYNFIFTCLQLCGMNPFTANAFLVPGLHYQSMHKLLKEIHSDHEYKLVATEREVNLWVYGIDQLAIRDVLSKKNAHCHISLLHFRQKGGLWQHCRHCNALSGKQAMTDGVRGTLSVKVKRIRRNPVLVLMNLECFCSFALMTADLFLLRSNEGLKFETQLREWYKFRWKYTSLSSKTADQA